MDSRRLRSWWAGASAVLLPELLLLACAASAPAPAPTDFPLHTVAPPVEMHWRLSTGPKVVKADGLVERRQHLLGSAWLQLLGLDAAGKIVSFTTPIRVSWRSDSDLESFAIPLRPRGGEQRFEMRLYSFEYPEENTP